jgi:hypothetical protein
MAVACTQSGTAPLARRAERGAGRCAPCCPWRPARLAARCAAACSRRCAGAAGAACGAGRCLPLLGRHRRGHGKEKSRHRGEGPPTRAHRTACRPQSSDASLVTGPRCPAPCQPRRSDVLQISREPRPQRPWCRRDLRRSRGEMGTTCSPRCSALARRGPAAVDPVDLRGMASAARRPSPSTPARVGHWAYRHAAAAWAACRPSRAAEGPDRVAGGRVRRADGAACSALRLRGPANPPAGALARQWAGRADQPAPGCTVQGQTRAPGRPKLPPRRHLRFRCPLQRCCPRAGSSSSTPSPNGSAPT